MEKHFENTISFVKLGTVNYIITKLNRFDNDTPFTFEEEEEDKGNITFSIGSNSKKGQIICDNYIPKTYK